MITADVCIQVGEKSRGQEEHRDLSGKELIFTCTRLAAYRVSLVFRRWKGITQSPQGGRAHYVRAPQTGQGHNQAL